MDPYTSSLAVRGLDRGEALVLSEDGDVLDSLLQLPREAQRRLLEVVRKGFGPSTSMGMNNFVRTAGWMYAMGQQFDVPQTYLVGPPKTSTTAFWNCLAGRSDSRGELAMPFRC